MATYKKRGHKPKNKKEELLQEQHDSTTAEVFSTLDESASKTEAWVSKNQNYILGIIGVIALGVLGYLAYDNFVSGLFMLCALHPLLERMALSLETFCRFFEMDSWSIDWIPSDSKIDRPSFDGCRL